MNKIIEETTSEWKAASFEGFSQDIRLKIEMEEHTTFLITDVFDVLMKANDTTGSHIELSPEFCFCPVLRDSSGQVLPLYRFIEILDECIDYEEIKEEIPTFSFAQINGAISFLRKIAQVNSVGIDVDAEIDQELLQNRSFSRELKSGLTDQESNHVLDLSQCNR